MATQPTSPQKPFLNIPETVSKEAQEFLRTLKDPALTPPFPDSNDLIGWKKVQAFVETEAKAQSETIVKQYAPTVAERDLGGTCFSCFVLQHRWSRLPLRG